MAPTGIPHPGTVPRECRVAVHDSRGALILASFLRHALAYSRRSGEGGLTILCIGTDRATGDALGPLVGTLLHERPPARAEILGTLEAPVHASNLAEVAAGLHRRQPSPLVLAVDACLGRSEAVGTVTAGFGALRPGAGVNKILPAVGDLHVTGTVNVDGFMEYFVLQNTRLHLVLTMARLIAQSLRLALEEGDAQLSPLRRAAAMASSSSLESG